MVVLILVNLNGELGREFPGILMFVDACCGVEASAQARAPSSGTSLSVNATGGAGARQEKLDGGFSIEDAARAEMLECESGVS